MLQRAIGAFSAGDYHMKKLTFATLAAVMALGAAGCTSTQQGAVIGGGVGAVAGQLIGGNTASTLIGAGTGALAGALIGDAVGRPGYCRYRNSHGQIYTARC
jgi:YMGG-like Gly-zipper